MNRSVRQVGVVLKDQGGAIVVADVDEQGAVVTGIESFAFDLDAMADRVAELDAEPPARRAKFIVDAAGVGAALWSVVAPARRDRRWELYEGQGSERQELVNDLLVALHDNALHFKPDLPGFEAMSAALIGYRRTVKEDGQIGSELIVALCLAITAPPPKKSIGWLV